jgi:glutathione synthase/RimK-type ligase-like ATP-grasp enzyme
MGNPWEYDLAAIATRSAPLLVVLGSDSNPAATGSGLRIGGSSDVYRLLPETLAFEQLNLSRQFFRPRGRPDLTRYARILNLVTDPDQHPQTLETLRKLLRGYKGRVINPPEAVLRSGRDQVARLLSGVTGLRVPRVVRLRSGKPELAARTVERAGLQFPLILRQAGTHTGKIVGLVESLDQLRAAMPDKGELIATEFVDMSGTDGLYRKYRIYFFGRRVVYRNMYLSDQWNVHSKDHARCLAARPDLAAELEAMFARPEGAFPEPVLETFREIRERMPLDFFGMDFGFSSEGQAVLFEANATMSFFPSWADMQFKHCLNAGRLAFRELVGIEA